MRAAHNSSTEASKTTGVFWSRMSSGSTGYVLRNHAIWADSEACGTATPLGFPVEPEVKIR
jgi:hypothetical protein